MKVAALCALLLLAGCAAPAQDPVPEPMPGVAEAYAEEQVTFGARSSLWVCGAFGCAGASGPSGASFDGKTYTGFRLEVRPSDAPAELGVEQPGLPGAQVRIVAECAGDSRTCVPGILAESAGPWPATLEASGFRIVDPDLLMFKVEYLGPYPAPVTGSGQGFDFEGTLTYVEGSEVADEDEDGEG
jgi:hypothetical protein